MGRFKNNPKKDKFLKSFPQSSADEGDLGKRIKFNFSYFDDAQEAGQSFLDWSQTTTENKKNLLIVLLEKLQAYSKDSLNYWAQQQAGGGGLTMLAIYGNFPSKSDFTHPNHVPHDARWARFRLQAKVRLIGFVIPENLNGQPYEIGNHTYYYDSNTFYVVFLDKNHKFYKTEKN